MGIEIKQIGKKIMLINEHKVNNVENVCKQMQVDETIKKTR